MKILLLSVSFSILLLISFVLPFFSSPGYSIIRNTISDLGAQSAPHAWLMNLAVSVFASVMLYTGWGFYYGALPQRVFLFLFSAMLILASVFRAVPDAYNARYNAVESGWHDYFISSAGLSFSILSITTGFIPGKIRERPFALVAGVSYFLLLVMISELKQIAGILQRVQFMISFGWLIFNFRKPYHKTHLQVSKEI